MSRKKIAIIGSGEMAVILVENAKKMGLETHTFSNDAHDRVVGLSDEHHLISIFDTDLIVETCKKEKVCGVLPTTELTISVAATIAEELGLNGMPVTVSKCVTDKGYVRKKVGSLPTIRQPEFLIWTIGDSVPIIKNYPVVVKPTAMGGKRGVSVAYSQKELEQALRYSIDCMPESKKQIIIEKFISGGKEYSVESLSFHGKHYVIQITEKITSGPPHCVELGHLQPALLPTDIHDKICRVIPEMLVRVGVDNTTAHTEIKVVGGEIYLIELNARSGGDHIAYPLVELSTGYPYIQGAINIAMNAFHPPRIEGFKKDCCGIIFIAAQTGDFMDLFTRCDNCKWLYRKNKKTEELVEIVNNQAFDTNYFIYCSSEGIPAEIAVLLKSRGIID